MKKSTKTGLAAVVGLGLGLTALVAASMPATADPSRRSNAFDVVGVAANPAFGIQQNVLATGISESPVAYGQLPLVNPRGGATYYGYNTSNGGPLTQNPKEAFKTEPDKNAYLVFGSKHYLFQGHEGGPGGYITRVDLDQPDLSKRVTMVADSRTDGAPVPTFDGITWDPFTHQLLLTAESAAPKGGVFAVTLDANGDPVDGKLTSLAALGSGGYEGVQNDSAGNVWLVEDIGGAAASGGKVPNSYVYRFTPAAKTDLSSGKLEALQVAGTDGSPITAQQLAANPSDPFIAALHSYGSAFKTTWVTLELGANNGSTAAAAAAGATPFKRPENGVFRPGSNFGEFYFTETGDTTATSALPGAFGGVFKLSQKSSTSSTGILSPVYIGDLQHTGFDNISFASKDQLLVVEDGGDGLHTQRNLLDSGYMINLGDRSNKAPAIVRWLGEGRDGSATYDHYTSPGYNDGDNEITGIHVSNGDTSETGILGAQLPRLGSAGWRAFWTQQHGDNITWELSFSNDSNHGSDH